MVLVLNADYMPVNIVSLKRGYKLVYKEKAEIVAIDKNPIKTAKKDLERPTVVRLLKYVKIPFKKVVLTRYNIFRRDNFSCVYCGDKKNLTIDHILPRSKGGLNSWENLVTCCSFCNVKKGDKTPEEAGMKLSAKPYVPNHIVFMFKAYKPKESWKPYMFECQ
jgi:5-methylcytosine-specific restriction endonuclease McrA